ncbi:MAG: DUF433 domain-containing protein [Thermomicrobiales bacterium]
MSTTIKTRAPVQRTEHPHIVKSADIFDGMPRVEGTRISVLQVVWWIESGWTPAQIAEYFPPLTLAQIQDALAYADDHPDEMAEHESRHTLRSVLKRADLVYVDGRLIPRLALKESDIPPGAEVYTWETLPAGKD